MAHDLAIQPHGLAGTARGADTLNIPGPTEITRDHLRGQPTEHLIGDGNGSDYRLSTQPSGSAMPGWPESYRSDARHQAKVGVVTVQITYHHCIGKAAMSGALSSLVPRILDGMLLVTRLARRAQWRRARPRRPKRQAKGVDQRPFTWWTTSGGKSWVCEPARVGTHNSVVCPWCSPKNVVLSAEDTVPLYALLSTVLLLADRQGHGIPT